MATQNDTIFIENDTENHIFSNTENGCHCEYCHKSFTTKRSMLRHIKKTCKVRQSIETKEQQIQELVKRIEQMEEQIHDNGPTNQIQTLNNHCSTMNNNQFNNSFKLNAFGDEDISYITDDNFKKILGKGFESVPALIQRKFYDKDHPENHNMYMSNFRSNSATIYDGEDWALTEANAIIEDLYDDNVAILEGKFDELKADMTVRDRKKFERFMKLYSDDTVVNQTKKNIKYAVYNGKRVVMKTRKLMGHKRMII